ncbi:Glycosyl transferase group 1 [Nitrosopumilaceae archaeon]|nr:glycosyltransferase family 4 protein [Nitrosopumilus sp.]MDA7997094.1 glycosyltransferase family 4 protein [Nitrosopumilus sp.]CAI9832045.1 Glycosyl transferase group 1 [Nitrosopumilaceae archaeon]
MKVAITCPASFPATQFGGIMFLAFNIARMARANGHDPTIYTTDLDFAREGDGLFNRDLPAEEERDGVRIRRSHVYARIQRFFINPGICSMIKKDKPDIIHAVGIRGFQSLAAALASKSLGVPLVVSDQGGLGTHPNAGRGATRILYRLQEPAIRMIIHRATRIIAANEYEKRIFSEYCDPAKIRIVRNGIDLGSIASPPFDYKSRHNLPRFLLFVGRLDHSKGPDILLRAARILKDSGKLDGAKILLMGPDFGFEGEVRSLIRDLDLGDVAVLVPNPSRDDVISAYHGCEFLVLPSRWEMSPLTPVEGFACGRTVVSSRIDGVADVIRDGVDGLLFEPESHEDLAEKTASLLDDPGLVKRLAASAGERSAMYSDARMWESLAAVYEECRKGT